MHAIPAPRHAPRARRTTTSAAAGSAVSLIVVVAGLAVTALPFQQELAPQQRAGIVRHRIQHRALLRIEFPLVVRLSRAQCVGALRVALRTLPAYAAPRQFLPQRLLRTLRLCALLRVFGERSAGIAVALITAIRFARGAVGLTGFARAAGIRAGLRTLVLRERLAGLAVAVLLRRRCFRSLVLARAVLRLRAAALRALRVLRL